MLVYIKSIICSAYINLIIGFMGVIFFLLIPVASGCPSCNFDAYKNSKLSHSVNSVEFSTSGVALVVSACPMALDLIMDILGSSEFVTTKSKQCWIGRAAITTVTLLLGLQVALKYDYFHMSDEYSLSYFFGLWCLRLIFVTAFTFSLCIIHPTIFTVGQTALLSAATVISGTLRFYGASSEFRAVIVLCQLSGYVYLILLLPFLYIWSSKLWKSKNKFSMDDYTAIYMLFMLGIGYLSVYSNVMYSWFHGVASFVVLDSSVEHLTIQIYAQTAVSVIMSIVPGRIARKETIVAKDHVIETKQAYVRYVSHELRTPLNTVFMGLQLATDQIPGNTTNPIEKDRRTTLQEICWACEIALDILNDLLLYDKLETGLVSLTKEKLFIMDFMSKSINMFLVQLRSKRLQLTFSTPEAEVGSPPLDDLNFENASALLNMSMVSSLDYIGADKSKFGQVGRNLISNAIKFTPNGGEIQVSVQFEPLFYDFLNIPIVSSTCSTKVQNSFSVCLQDTENSGLETIVSESHIITTHPQGIGNAIDDTESGIGSNNLKVKQLKQLHFQESEAQYQNQSSIPAEKHCDEKSIDCNDGIDVDVEVDCDDGETKSEAQYQHSAHSQHCVQSAKTTFKITQTGMLVIEVKDSGVGISLEDQERLFKEIVQFKPEVLQGGGGSGLGLFITKGIVDLHGGKISVHSEGEGKGTTFRVEIPMTRESTSFISANVEPRSIVSTRGGLARSFFRRTSKSFRQISSTFYTHPSSNSPVLFSNTNSVSVNNCLDNNGLEQQSKRTSLKILGEWNFKNDVEKTSDERAVGALLTSSVNVETASLSVSEGHEAKTNSTNENCMVSSNFALKEDFILDAEKSYSQNCSYLMTSDQSTTAPKASLHLLVVDDSGLNRKMLRRLLEAQGHVCEEAEDGLIAVNMMKDNLKLSNCSNGFDAIMMDFVMPNMNGPTATTEIRKLGYKGLIIGVTGNALVQDKDILITAGASRVFTKPLDISFVTAAFKDCGLL